MISLYPQNRRSHQKLLIALVLSAHLFAQTSELQQKPLKQIKTEFAVPDMLYAPFVFWFWDKPIDSPQTQSELTRMAQKMLEQRLNPGYIHARFNMVGQPDLPFAQWLSPAWFAAMDGVMDQCAEANGYFGFVNEYWWPSGRAAGRVLKQNPDLWAESLQWDTIDVAGDSLVRVPASFFVAAAKRSSRQTADRSQWSRLQTADCGLPPEGDKNVKESSTFETIPHSPVLIESSSLRIIGSGEAYDWRPPDDGPWRIYVFNAYYHPGCDGGRLNYLDLRLAEAFLREAHEPYAAHFGDQLGDCIPGVFVDHEGGYGYKLAWSDDLAAHYRKKTGEDIRQWMPLLIDEDVEGRFVKARWDWFDAVSDIYADYFNSINRWCTDHNLYAISNLWEETLMWQASGVGDFFKVQRAFSMPGTDALGLNILKPHDFMETKSVCEFEGRRMQSEIMGGSGFWGFNNITIKQAANAAITWGVSHIVPHAIWATRTLQGNPWLPDWFDENPWWPQMHLWSDFVRRASYINSQGHSAADVLLLNPMDSVWGWCGPGVFDPAFRGRVPVPAIMPLQTEADIRRTPAEVKQQSAWWIPPNMNDWYNERVHEINSIYSRAIDDLVAHRIEFLIADRHYVRQMDIKDRELVREPFHFKSIILPAMDFLPLDVAEKIVSFAEGGGRVYVLDSWPRGSTDVGLGDPKITELVARLQPQPTVVFCDSTLTPELQKRPPQLRSHLQFESGEFNLLQQYRRIDGREFFWLANNTGREQKCTLLLDRRGLGVEKWNCETGQREVLPTRLDSAHLSVQLTFDPYEAFWLVEGPPHVNSGASRRVPIEPDTISLKKNWLVRINPENQPNLEQAYCIPDPFVHGVEKPLAPWADWGLQDFSGVVTYESNFFLDRNYSTITLDLGKVHVAAQVWINGNLVGERLWPPYRYTVSPVIHTGENHIKIKIGNLLNNTYGDNQKSGLIGPVIFIVQP